MKNLVTRELVRQILTKATAFEWTVQGFGFLRLPLGKLGRIHIWDSALTVPDVSVIHSHFWNLQSEIISGCLRNIRYHVNPVNLDNIPATHWEQRLITGEGGGLIEKPRRVQLISSSTEIYHSGSAYSQRAEEVHETQAFDGTVTVMQRPKGGDGETALVYWAHNKQWGSAEPRPATREEVEGVTGRALAAWR